MGNEMLQRGAAFLRAALDEGTPRTIVTDPGGPDRPRTVTLEPPVANDRGEPPSSSERGPEPTTPTGGPANERER